jgi:hypothetical protein
MNKFSCSPAYDWQELKEDQDIIGEPWQSEDVMSQGWSSVFVPGNTVV